jgi:hypothetical protein
MERSLENLQFVVWYQSYKQRHLAQPDLSCAPSPVAATTAPSSSTGSDPSKPTSFGQRIALSIDTRSLGHSTTPTTKSDTGRTCFNDPLRSSDTLVTPTNSGTAPWLSPRLKEDHYDDQAMPATSFVATPTSLQAQDPFRDECERIVATFFSPSSRKELSLDSDTRDGVLHNLTRSTHPDVFSPAYDAIFYTLQTYSLPRFFACASAATNRPNQIFWFAWGITCLCISLVIYVTTLVFAPWDDFRSRALRLICVFPAMMGTSFPYAAAQGYCLNVSGRRKNMQLRPWELEALGAATREWWIGIISPIVVPNANQEQLGPDLEVAENRDANSGEPADSSQSSAVLPARLARIAARRARERREAMLADVAIIAPFVGDTILHQDSPSRLVYSEGAGPAPITISFTRQTETYVTEDHHAPPSITGNKDSIVNFEIDDNSMTRESSITIRQESGLVSLRHSESDSQSLASSHGPEHDRYKLPHTTHLRTGEGRPGSTYNGCTSGH